MKKILFFLFLSLYTFTPVVAQWRVQPVGSSVAFRIKNAGINVDGTFNGFSASVLFDPNQLPEARLSGTIQAKTINTGINGRDNHLRKEEYFSVDKYPTISFTSTAITKKGNAYLAKGNLTIKDVTKMVEIPFTFQQTNQTTALLTGQIQIDRRHYHIGGNSWVMGDNVNITVILKLSQP